ncbi:MAG: bifunctional glutamate N-acetyltransferase/amino-acid acetyltransferase ArgJ [Dehalococcoidia bacterium]|nr:bifunctional glutamate N-acetyltransferase/amino-acid acetyltransferase ArgJ [Dehalococcoidia bacterium]
MDGSPSSLDLEWIEGGGLDSPLGFRAGGIYTGVKTYGDEPRLDLGLMATDGPCTVAGMFTQNQVVGDAVLWDRAVVASGSPVRALICNSGCSNVLNGEQGARDTRRMAELVAERLGVAPEEVLIGSTGVIGRPLPMPLIERGIADVDLRPDGGFAFARAIMTTDTHPKHAAVRFTCDGRTYTIGGCIKGSGMIHPDMATMFGFLTTDAPAERDWLQATLREVVGRTFNMVDIDMDTSTSDTALLFASGAAGGEPVTDGHPAAASLHEAIEVVARYLARELARDGEGAQTLIEVVAEGAASLEDARRAARTVASSPLVKTMIVGRDPNWGRVMMAAGRSGARFDQHAASVWVGEHQVLDRGTPTSVDLALVSQAMGTPEVQLRVHLGAGEATATAWGCDLTEGYVRINADYTT